MYTSSSSRSLGLYKPTSTLPATAISRSRGLPSTGLLQLLHVTAILIMHMALLVHTRKPD